MSAAADALSCPLCLDTFRHPLMLPCCGQSFCADCLRQALDVSSLCPLCRCKTSFDAALPNRGLGALLAHDRQDVLAAVAAAVPPPPVVPAPELRSCRPPPRLLSQQEPPTSGPGYGRSEHHHMHVPSGGLSPYQMPPVPRRAGWGGWWSAHANDARCVLYIVLVLLVFFFLRVQEEEYQEMEEEFRRAHPSREDAHPRLLGGGTADPDKPLKQNDRRGHHAGPGSVTGGRGEPMGGHGATEAGASPLPATHGLAGQPDAATGVYDRGGSAVERAWTAEKAHPISRGDTAYVGDARWAAVGILGTLVCVVQLGRRALRKRQGTRRGSRGAAGRRRPRGGANGGEWGRSEAGGEVSEARV